MLPNIAIVVIVDGAKFDTLILFLSYSRVKVGPRKKKKVRPRKSLEENVGGPCWKNFLFG